VAFAADGRSLVSASHDGTARLWDARTGALLRRLWGHTKPLRSVAISADGATLATGSDDGTVRVWSPSSGAERHVLRSHRDIVHAVAVSPDGATIASASQDQSVRLWDARTGAERRSFEGSNPFFDVAFTPDGKTVIAFPSLGSTLAWDAATWRSLPPPPLSRPIAFTPDGRTLLGGSNVDRYDLHLEARLGALRGYGVHALALRADGRAFLTADDEAWAVEEWDLATGRPLRKLDARASSIRAIAWSPGGQLLAAASDAGTALLFPLDARDGVRRLVDAGPWKVDRGAASALGAIAFSPGGETLAWISGDGSARLWSVGAGDAVRRLDHWHEVTALAFHPGSAELATLAEHTVRYHDVATGHRRGQVELPASSFTSERSWWQPFPRAWLAFSPDGAFFAAGSRTLDLWNAAGGTLNRHLDGEDQALALAFHPSAAILATGHPDGSIHLRDLARPGEPRTLSAHARPITALAWTSDGKTLATASEDGTVRLFDALTSAARGRPLVHPHPVVSLAFRPDGALLATSDGRALRLWSAAGVLLIELGAAPGGGTYALTPGPDARLEIVGDVPRELFACRAGPWTFPLDLCEEPSRATGLLRRALAVRSP
jgi:WD40 repeat protein